jgi:hypothetical protein
MLLILIHLHFHHIKLCGIMQLECMNNYLTYRNYDFFCYNRGKSTHPGVVVDLCQNPDDPARVRRRI